MTWRKSLTHPPARFCFLFCSFPCIWSRKAAHHLICASKYPSVVRRAGIITASLRRRNGPREVSHPRSHSYSHGRPDAGLPCPARSLRPSGLGTACCAVGLSSLAVDRCWLCYEHGSDKNISELQANTTRQEGCSQAQETRDRTTYL